VSEAWEFAHRAAAAAAVDLRPLGSLEDADRIMRVVSATWGDEQSLPRELLRAFAESGNVPYGAFAGEDLVGCVIGWVGVDPNEGLHVHSHMLATIPAERLRGVGYALKLAQRAQALDHGIRFVRWTFDPLVARNAYFNLRKLGAVADRFERNYYGQMTDALNRGDRSDRFMVRWDVEAPPGPWTVTYTGDPTVVRRAADERPERIGDVVGEAAIVEIPREHGEIRSSDPDLAMAWRDAVADAAEACLARGLVAASFDRARSAYVFGRTYAREPVDAATT
jgi:predicted GNAT superfamily acetyltransferase